MQLGSTLVESVRIKREFENAYVWLINKIIHCHSLKEPRISYHRNAITIWTEGSFSLDSTLSTLSHPVVGPRRAEARERDPIKANARAEQPACSLMLWDRCSARILEYLDPRKKRARTEIRICWLILQQLLSPVLVIKRASQRNPVFWCHPSSDCGQVAWRGHDIKGREGDKISNWQYIFQFVQALEVFFFSPKRATASTATFCYFPELHGTCVG